MEFVLRWKPRDSDAGSIGGFGGELTAWVKSALAAGVVLKLYFWALSKLGDNFRAAERNIVNVVD